MVIVLGCFSCLCKLFPFGIIPPVMAHRLPRRPVSPPSLVIANFKSTAAAFLSHQRIRGLHLSVSPSSVPSVFDESTVTFVSSGGSCYRLSETVTIYLDTSIACSFCP
ncbi:hypothetical protein SLA2020_338810 [Shorea laevis]